MLIFVISFVVFLFTVYQLAKDDFVFLRKGVSLDEVFDTIFFGLLVSLFFSRIFFVIQHPSLHYLNPFIFFLVSYFPGLSLTGGILGGLLFTLIYAGRKNMPVFRVLDIFSVSFILSFGLGILLQGVLFFIAKEKFVSIVNVIQGIICISFFIFLISLLIKNKWVEGAIAYIVISLYCLLGIISLIIDFFIHKRIQYVGLGGLGIVLLFSSFLFLYKVGFSKRILKK